MTNSFQHLILNVDDNEGARYVKTRIFERAGYRVLEAGTGGDALKLVHQNHPHLVLLDVGLPDISGLEVCRQIKNDVVTAHVMVLQVSASSVTSQDRVRGLTGGADVYLTEPVDSAELLGAAKALLRLHDREEETRVLLKELTERERFIKNLIDAAPSTVYLYDLRCHRNLYANAKSDAMLGYELEGLQLVDEEALKQLVHQEDLPYVVSRFEGLSSMRDGEVLEIECRIKSHSGEWHWVSLRIVIFVRDAKGDPIQILGTAQDVTDRKRNELANIERDAALLRAEQRSTAELEQKVRERTLELSHSRMRLRSLASELTLAEQRERKRIATDLHDYLAQLLVLGRMKLGQAKRDDTTLRSRPFVQELDDLLTKALTYTRSLVGELSPPILREFGLVVAIKWLAEQMSRHEMMVTVNCDVELALVMEDQAILLFQSVRELLINASKHARTPHVSVSVWSTDNMLHLCVADEGVGFDTSNKSMNGQADRFGLFSIRERMDDIGGRMSIVSAPGQGTKVTLSVSQEVTPLKEADSRHSQESESARDSVKPSALRTVHNGDALHGISSQDGRKTTRVLLVDDHVMLRQGLRTVLDEYSDIEVLGEAANGEEALTLAKSLKPDVVIMDVNMPGMDGIEATRRLKKELPGTIVVGLSVANTTHVEEVMRHAGAVAFLTKDAAIEQLHETIVQALRSA